MKLDIESDLYSCASVKLLVRYLKMATAKKFQVFVSSTFTDLVHERQAAVSAILKAGHIPAGMELFTAGSESQLETIYRWIDQCDIYMLVLGGRYGSLEPKSNVSYTELEYDYATNAGKPVFAVVIEDAALDEKVKAAGRSAIENENPVQLKQFREKALSKTSSFFSDNKDIKLCVHESLGDLAADEQLIGWVRGDDVVDTRALNSEITQLRAENEDLKKNASNSQIGSTRQESTFTELVVLLESTIVKVPSNVSGKGEESERNLLEIFFSNKEALISGVTNANGNGDVSEFYYFNILPKLQIHELAANEKIAGVRYRRSYVTSKGLQFLADFERKLLKAENESSE
jgi:hypothetical protein